MVVAPGKNEKPLVIPPVQEYDVAPVPLNVTVVPAQTDEEGAAVAPTVGARLGLMVIAIDDAVPLPQELTGVTEIFPELEPKRTLILVVFCPDTIDEPDGILQV